MHQSGNRKFHSTETLGLAAVDNIFKAIDEKKLTAMVMIDLSKAFDSISPGAEEASKSWGAGFERHFSNKKGHVKIFFRTYKKIFPICPIFS